MTVQTWLVDLVDYQPISTPEDGRRLVDRWRAFGRHIDGAIEGLRRGMARGQVSTIVPLERVVDELRTLLSAPAEDWRMAGPARDAHDDWPPTERDAFRRYKAIRRAEREFFPAASAPSVGPPLLERALH